MCLTVCDKYLTDTDVLRCQVCVKRVNFNITVKNSIIKQKHSHKNKQTHTHTHTRAHTKTTPIQLNIQTFMMSHTNLLQIKNFLESHRVSLQDDEKQHD